MVVAFRRHTLLPLDDCLYALQPSIPHLTRSSLHRCLQRHGISRPPDPGGDKPKRQKFKRYPVARQGIAKQWPERGLAIFISISPKSEPKKESCFSLWPLTEPESLRWRNWSRRPIARRRGNSLNIFRMPSNRAIATQSIPGPCGST